MSTTCQICGKPMPAGEEMFKYHGYSGPCPIGTAPGAYCSVTGLLKNEVDGVTYVNTHSGQKNPYGHTFHEYDIASDLPFDEVERVCREKIHSAISHESWLAKQGSAGASMGDYFLPHYTFNGSNGKFKYVVIVCFND